MKKIPHLTLSVAFAFFVVAAAWLWTSASANVTRQTTRMFAVGPRTADLAAYSAPSGFVDGLFEAPWRGFDTGIFDSGFGPNSFAMGDLDGDGDLDILVGESFFGSPGISVLKNNGDQTFAAPVYYPAPINEVVGEVALSDFDL